jgi:hypothetical protein
MEWEVQECPDLFSQYAKVLHLDVVEVQLVYKVLNHVSEWSFLCGAAYNYKESGCYCSDRCWTEADNPQLFDLYYAFCKSDNTFS